MNLHLAHPRTSDWILTFTGRQFWPLDPRVDDVCIEDIAHALANTCRFCGHSKHFYSVAQHSVLVAETVAASLDAAADRSAPSMARAEIHRGAIRWALLHDASEAYLHDITRPLKRTDVFGEGYAKAERRLMRVIATKFNLMGEQPEVVEMVDGMLLATEIRDLMLTNSHPMALDFDPLPEAIVPWTPAQAESMFLRVFESGVGEVRHV